MHLIQRLFRLFLRLTRAAWAALVDRRFVKDSAPFLSSDLWLRYADLCVTDPDSHPRLQEVVDRCALPFLLIETGLLPGYAEFLGALQKPFVLITTCNDDLAVPFVHVPCLDPELMSLMNQILSNKNLVRWFTKNPGIVHEKLFPLPLGPKWQWSCFEFFGENKSLHRRLFLKWGCRPNDRFLQKVGKKSKLLYFNFGDTTQAPFFAAHRGMRAQVRDQLLSRFSWNPSTDYRTYLKVLADHKFCLSPPGRGVDTHRTWEALMVGTIPIMVHSPLDPLFETLPVVLVDDFSSITEEFLNDALVQIHKRTYSFEICYSPYWDRLFQRLRERPIAQG